MRATDEMVRSALTWARNYEEIQGFECVAGRGRKWRVRLDAGVQIGSRLVAGRPQDAVPPVLILTNREALAFAYGCAVGGAAHGRTDFARERWGW